MPRIPYSLTFDLEAEGLYARSRGVEERSDDTPGHDATVPFYPRLPRSPTGCSSVSSAMASTLTKVLVHVTFSTKLRTPMIAAPIEADLYSYVGGICRRTESPLHAMNGTADHVHMVVSLGKTVALSDLLLNIKRDSSKWIKAADAAMTEFAWQEGYFAFSIGQSGEPALRAYIANQKEHHVKVSFQNEMRAFLRKYHVAWDERYVWE